MTLRRRFLIHNLGLVGMLLIAGGISAWRLEALREEVDLPRSAYAELRNVAGIAVNLGTVRGLLAAPVENRDVLVRHLSEVIGAIDQFIRIGQGYGDAAAADASMRQAYGPINASAASARERLQTILDRVQGAPAAAALPISPTALPISPAALPLSPAASVLPVLASPSPSSASPGASAASSAALRDQADLAIADIDRVADDCVRFIGARNRAAADRVALNLTLIGVMSMVGILAAAGLGFGQDRLVMVPLQRLRDGVARISGAQFGEAIDPPSMGSTREFQDLAADFNRMARELDGFYKRLEDQVREKSRELVRSERMASVGFLAAGVAHEINNPLNVISGYAELTGRQLEADRLPLGEAGADEARESLRVIRDEVFRCKEITEKLLSLLRDGKESREPLDLCGVVRDVASMTRGLKDYRDRRVSLEIDDSGPLEVQANLTEMKQVLLNLTINALQSAPAEGGEVSIEARCAGDWVVLAVRDNGQGMVPEVLRHVFEPFFTARRADRAGSARGTGLGLSITHAIVESHGGRISAESAGPGKGARFTVRLPARFRAAAPA